MSLSPDKQIANLKQAMAALEAQRTVLSDEVVDAGLASMRQKLVELVGDSEAPAQQRKLATILFADVAGSTQIAKQLDPEVVVDIMDAALKRLAEPIQRHGGRVTRFQGDGFKAIFGLPVARENDPEQAIHGGLQILKIAEEIAGELQTERGIAGFKVRVGINTGLIAAGGSTEAQDTVMGKAVNLAARLESAAPAGGLLISHDTYRHVRGVFDIEPLAPLQAKGFDEPIPVYLVQRAKPRAFRSYRRGVEGVETHMIGRQDELKYLQDALIAAIEEVEGQIVTIVGEAGIGKSRLIYEFQNWIELIPQEIRLFAGRGQQETQDQPFAVLRDMFAFRFEIRDNDPPASARQKFQQGIAEAFSPGESAGAGGERGVRAAHFIGQMIGFEFRESPHLSGFVHEPQALRSQALKSLGEYFQAVCRAAPVLIIIEDLHWADDSSLDTIKHLGLSAGELPLVVIGTARQRLHERRPYWSEGQLRHHRLDLRSLSRRDSCQLVEEILQKVERVPAELRELVLSGAEGNPFYIEEVIKTLIEAGMIVKDPENWRVEPERVSGFKVPATLTGVVQARLDGLPEIQRTALQQASILGRVFWEDAVAQIHAATNGKKETSLFEELSALRDKELIFRREESAFAGTREYIFKHDLLREITYETVLIKTRKIYHGVAADWLIENAGERMGEIAGVIGEHLERAGRSGEAAGYMRRAGEQALGSAAIGEAQNYFRRALSLDPEDHLRAALLEGLGEALARRGDFDEAMRIRREGIRQYESLGDLQGVARLFGVAVRDTIYSGKSMEGLQLAKEALDAVKGLPEGPELAALLHQAGQAHFLKGELEPALSLCGQALALAERLADIEMQADILCTLGLLWMSKRPQQSLSCFQEAIELAERHGYIWTSSRAHNNLAWFLLEQWGDFRSALPHCERAIEIVRKLGFSEEELFFLHNLAFCYLKMGDLAGAKEIDNRIKKLLKEVDDPDVHGSNQKFFKGYLWGMRGKWRKALALQREALRQARKDGDPHLGFELSTASLAPLLLDMHRFLGKRYLHEAESILKEAGDFGKQGLYVGGRVAPNCLLSAVRARQGQLEEARQLFDEARAAFDGAPTYSGRAPLAFARAELSVTSNPWPETMEAYQALVNLAIESEQRWQEARACLYWAEACAAHGEPDDLARARQLYQRSVDIFSEIGAPGYTKVAKQRLSALISPDQESSN